MEIEYEKDTMKWKPIIGSLSLGDDICWTY